ncbi:MAG: MFS transporter [Methanomassiliicoccales archaeon]
MEYKWKVLLATTIGTLMSSIDSTIVLLALFPIASSLHSDFISVIWVIIAYILMSTALVLSLGRISDMYGRKRMYNLGFIVFTVGSALCGISLSIDQLIVFRAIQGIGAAMLVANSFALVSEAFNPAERGRAFGINSIVWGSGTVIGIILGGIIITFTSWRLIFLINVPIGIAGTLLAYKVIRESAWVGRGREENFDLPAALLFTGGLLFLLLGITFGLFYGWGKLLSDVAFVLAPITFAFFVLWESRYAANPIIDFSIFSNRLFTFSIISAMLQSVAIFSVNFLLIFYFEGIAGLSILNASYLIIPMAAMTSIVGPFGGVLSDRAGARTVAATGLAVQAITLFLLSRLTVGTPLFTVGLLEAAYGVGGGLFWPANTSAIMGAADRSKFGVASGIMNTFRNTGMVLSFALSLIAATSVIPAGVVYGLFIGNISGHLPLSMRTDYLTGEGFAFTISTILLAAAIVFSLIRASTNRRGGVPAKETA